MITRRAFLPASAAALHAARSAAAPAGEFTLGVASYSLRKFTRAQAIEIIRKLGVRYVCIKEFHLRYADSPEARAAGRREFEDAGLVIVGGGTVYMLKDDDADIRFYFDYARDCGMPLMVIGATRQNLPRIERFVKEYNIKVAVHNHGPEDKHFPTPESALEVIRDMDPRVGLCVDVGHTARMGIDPVESILRAGPRVLDVHIKDLRDIKKRGSDCPVGEGVLPIVGIFRALRRIGYRASVNLEYEIEPDDPFLGMAKSFAYMRGVLAGLTA